MTTKEKLTELLPDVQEPYQLHHILRAIAGHPRKYEMWVDGETFEEDGPHLVIRIEGDDTDEGIESWDLKYDYDNQIQEVKDFIGKLLNI